jgi:hypothetical protein
MQRTQSDPNPSSSAPLSDTAVRRIMTESAAGIEYPNSRLYEIVEEQITAHPHSQNQKETGDLSPWAKALSALRRLYLQPRLAWGVAAIQAAIIVFFLFSPQTGLRLPANHDYQTLSTVTNSSAVAQNLYLVIFHDSASVTAIAKLLRRTHATITDGPGENGIFTLKIAGNERARKEAARILENSPLVAFCEKRLD